MWKLLLLHQCLALILRGLGHGVPLRPEETWKPLDNPRNRDLFFRTLKAYFSERGLDLQKFPDALSVINDKPKSVAYYFDPAAFEDYEDNKNSYKLSQGLKNTD